MNTTGRQRNSLALLGFALLLVFVVAGPHAPRVTASPAELDGDASSGIATRPPNTAVQAAFAKRSYAPGAHAILRLRGSAPLLRIQLFRAGAGHDGPLQGSPVTKPQTLRNLSSSVPFPVGSWPS